ncbi:acyltransferase family protein [Murdochiella vaginalis]|uniref:acyltransferase family protein n=1 Tax=Murdochiella vaginalis TaxID=1852373 RepID=UPI0008FE4DBF|nr:acyltransferase family protein [Murdochiella vaginalis]
MKDNQTQRKEINQLAPTSRNISYDLLRICAAGMVVLLHVSVSCFYELSPGSASWFAMNCYDSMVRSSDPLFFMLSGVFLLKRTFP